MEPRKSVGPLVWMIVSQALAVGTLLPWFAMAGLAFMAFDSGVTWQAMVFVGVMWAYPLVPLVLSILAWVYYRRGRVRTAMVLTSALLLPAVLMAALLMVLPHI